MRSSAARRWSMSWSARRAIIICRNCWRGQRRRPRAGDRISGRGQVRLPAAAEAGGDPRPRHFVVRHGAGRLRQVLHLLRRALYARHRSVAAGGQDRRRRAAARRQRRARDHADRPERQRLSRRRPGRPAWSLGTLLYRLAEIPGIVAAALLDQPSARRRRRADRRAPRSARADAVRASAGAVRLRPDSGGHEPQTYRRRLSPRYRPVPRGAPRYCVFIGFYRRLPRRDRGRFSRQPSRLSRKSVTLAPIRSNIRRGRARRRRTCGRRCQRPRWTSDWCGFRT